jgi:hypothetical protein
LGVAQLMAAVPLRCIAWLAYLRMRSRLECRLDLLLVASEVHRQQRRVRLRFIGTVSLDWAVVLGGWICCSTLSVAVCSAANESDDDRSLLGD